MVTPGRFAFGRWVDLSYFILKISLRGVSGPLVHMWTKMQTFLELTCLFQKLTKKVPYFGDKAQMSKIQLFHSKWL